jgi:hypothetical protein
MLMNELKVNITSCKDGHRNRYIERMSKTQSIKQWFAKKYVAIMGIEIVNQVGMATSIIH